jgi:hypothetical protein
VAESMAVGSGRVMLVPTDNCRKDFAVGYGEDTLPTGAMRQMLKLFSLAEIPRNQSLSGNFRARSCARATYRQNPHFK